MSVRRRVSWGVAGFCLAGLVAVVVRSCELRAMGYVATVPLASYVPPKDVPELIRLYDLYREGR